MELIIKTNDEASIAKIINLAKELHVVVEKRGMEVQDAEALKERLLNFKAKGPSSFGDAAEWEREQRKGRDLPFSE